MTLVPNSVCHEACLKSVHNPIAVTFFIHYFFECLCYSVYPKNEISVLVLIMILMIYNAFEIIKYVFKNCI